VRADAIPLGPGRARPRAPSRRGARPRRGRPAAAWLGELRAGAELGRSLRARVTRANLVAGCAFLGAAAAQLWIGLQVDRLGYRLAEARHVGQVLRHEVQVLRVEWAASTAPRELSRAARDRLGLAAPAPGQVVVLP